MKRIVSVKTITQLSTSFKKKGKKVVLVGGCFDLLHPGHLIFLEKAKACGDILIVLLESDQKVKKLKGSNRPIYHQQVRASLLTSLKSVDYVVMLPYLKDNHSYDQLISAIKPNIIAATFGDINISHHQRVAKITGAKLKYVTKAIGNYSTSNILASTD